MLNFRTVTRLKCANNNTVLSLLTVQKTVKEVFELTGLIALTMHQCYCASKINSAETYLLG